MEKTIFDNEGGIRLTLLLMLFAYLFSFAIRMIWVYQVGDIPSYQWHGQLMINTNDGYFFASGAQKELFGTLQHNPRVPDWLSYGVIFLTTMIAKYTPFSLDTVILYLPAIVSSFVVVPIILIGRLYGSQAWGFFAALLGSIAWSYYNRTMTGYYDTDMFSAMLPMFILYFLLAMLETERKSFMLWGALTIAIYPFLYDSGLSLVYAMGLLYMLYMVVFYRKERFTYESITLVAIALMGLPIWLKISMIAIAYAVFSKIQMPLKRLMVVAAVFVTAFLISGNVFGLIFAKVSSYMIRGVEEGSGLKFFKVAQTVREAGRIPFELMANRIIGSVPGLFVALAGYLLLVVRHRGFILALPLIGIGIFSLWGGLRFTVYAVPVAALSATYLFYFLSEKFIESHRWRLGAMGALTAAMLYPNITHIVGYRVPTVFNNSEVAALDRLAKIGDDRDYVITWWDYGYPIWYYANKNTLIDGGKHNHDNFIVSEILTTDSQLEAARLSRIAIETYIANGYKTVADTLFENGKERVDPNRYLAELRDSASVALPKKSVDIYLYLPYRMLNIFPTVALFSQVDLLTGKKRPRPFFYLSRRFYDTAERLDLGEGLWLDKKSGMLHVGSRETGLRRVVTVTTKASGEIKKRVQEIDPLSPLSLIYLASYQSFLLVDETMYRSLFVRLFVLGEYDPALFELVEVSPYARVYRLKI